MSLLSEQLEIGVIWGTVYTFENVGDELPRHVHGESDTHITICARGVVDLCTDVETVQLSAGQCADTAPGVHHWVIAKEPNSRIYNIRKNNGTNS